MKLYHKGRDNTKIKKRQQKSPTAGHDCVAILRQLALVDAGDTAQARQLFFKKICRGGTSQRRHGSLVNWGYLSCIL